MTESFNLTLVQKGPTVGALDKNADTIVAEWHQAKHHSPDLVAFPELFLSGYPVQDLVLKPAFVEACRHRVEQIAASCQNGPMLGFGAPSIVDGKLHNAYFFVQHGKIRAEIQKHQLPNSEVFDEMRQFEPAQISGPVQIGAARIGLAICQDAWSPDVCEAQVESGADIFLVVNGSPYYRGKMDDRVMQMVGRVIETQRPLAYLNMVGGQDDQVFDGGSFVLNSDGALRAQLPVFDDIVKTVRFEREGEIWKADKSSLNILPDDWEQDYRAMVEGVRDFLGKNGFSRAVVGLSGGVDSALVAAIATDALGGENVHCVMLPSQFTSQESRRDAAHLAANLGCRFDTLRIDRLHTHVESELAETFSENLLAVTQENIQSRLRAVLLMAISNQFNQLLLATSNKSEAAVGYSTIYGDMAGAYNPIKDLYKTRVFETCRWRNHNHRPWMKGVTGICVPDQILKKPPSAELRPNQRDTDSLPPYDVLDEILELLIDQDKSVEEVNSVGFDLKIVSKVERLIYSSEHKRFQSPPGVKLTKRALWLDRRYPIVNQWRDSRH